MAASASLRPRRDLIVPLPQAERKTVCLLTDAEYQASLHRAQENPGDLKPQKLREVTGEKNLNEPKREQLNG